MIHEIYSAIFARLDAQLATPVFGHVPEGEDGYPFTRVDPLELDNNDTDTETGFTGEIQIVTFSRFKGGEEVSGIALNVYDALHRYAMPDTSSYAVSTIHQNFSNIIPADDGLTRHSVQRFKIIFEPIPV